jgi:hypothetical protein
MSTPFSTFADDFYINMRLGSQIQLPHQRDTVLHFFDRIQKEFPAMTRFRKSDGGEFSLEEDRKNDSYRWASLEPKRLASGHVNPEDVAETTKLHAFLLELAPFHLGLNPLEIDYLDVLFGFDLEFSGNHDEVIAESVLGDSPLLCLAEGLSAKPIDIQPTLTFALSDDCRLQARIDIVTRTNSHQVRTGDYSNEMISVYLIVRRYWGDRPKQSIVQVFNNLTERAEQICSNFIVPRVLRPISSAIASRS